MGASPLEGPEFPGGHYVRPCIASAKNSFAIVQEETFAPILYVIGYGEVSSSRKKSVDELVEAMQLHNDVPQGLSSAIFTEHIREAEYFLSHRGSDCGIANVNIGTSGAEIGGAFGGEKETGWGEGVRLGRLEGLYAATDQHHQLEHGVAVGPGNRVRLVGCAEGRRMNPVGRLHVWKE